MFKHPRNIQQWVFFAFKHPTTFLHSKINPPTFDEHFPAGVSSDFEKRPRKHSFRSTPESFDRALHVGDEWVRSERRKNQKTTTYIKSTYSNYNLIWIHSHCWLSLAHTHTHKLRFFIFLLLLFMHKSRFLDVW